MPHASARPTPGSRRSRRRRSSPAPPTTPGSRRPRGTAGPRAGRWRSSMGAGSAGPRGTRRSALAVRVVVRDARRELAGRRRAGPVHVPLGVVIGGLAVGGPRLVRVARGLRLGPAHVALGVVGIEVVAAGAGQPLAE